MFSYKGGVSIRGLRFLHPADLFYFWLMDSTRVSTSSNYMNPILLGNGYINVDEVNQHGIDMSFAYHFRSVKQYHRR